MDNINKNIEKYNPNKILVALDDIIADCNLLSNKDFKQ